MVNRKKLKGATMLLLAAMVPTAEAFDLDPACHKLYEMFQMPDLTYEDVGKIADHMHQNDCWPAMQGLLPEPPPPTQSANGLPSCQDLASHLATDESILKLFDARPLRGQDCGSPPSYLCSAESVTRRKQEVHQIRMNREKWLAQEIEDDTGSGMSKVKIQHAREKLEAWNVAEELAAIDQECNLDTSGHISHIRYEVSQQEVFRLTIGQCNALVKNPETVELSLPRPVNCRAKVVYADGVKSGLYMWVDQYPDGDTGVWSVPIRAWAW